MKWKCLMLCTISHILFQYRCPPVSLEVNENRSACSPEDDERLMWTSVTQSVNVLFIYSPHLNIYHHPFTGVERKMEGPLLPSINNKGAESVAPDYSMYSRKTKSAAVRLLSGKAVKKSLSEIVDSSDSLSIEVCETLCILCNSLLRIENAKSCRTCSLLRLLIFMF